MIVVAEGAGQNLLAQSTARDASGNVKHGDIGAYLRDTIQDHFRQSGTAISLKDIDPSYAIRSVPATAHDSAFCLLLGHHAVHAGMSGRTNMVVNFWNHHFTHVPISVAVSARKKIDPEGELWTSVLGVHLVSPACRKGRRLVAQRGNAARHHIHEETQMSAEIVGTDGRVVTARVTGTLTQPELSALQHATGEIIRTSGHGATARDLVEQFAGWQHGANWSDFSFQMQHDAHIERMAIVGDMQWKDLTLLFTADGLRSFPIAVLRTFGHRQGQSVARRADRLSNSRSDCACGAPGLSAASGS